MKQLNNRGVTTIEVLMCFVIVVIITVSMYSTISYYNERRILEGYKQKVIEYKNIVTSDIQTDLIRIGLVDVKIDRNIDTANAKTTYTVDMTMKDSSQRRLIVEQTLTYSDYHPKGSMNVDDAFKIMYGNPIDMEGDNSYSQMIDYGFPKLGSYEPQYKNSDGHMVPTGHIAQDLSINNVIIEIVNDRALSIYIGFYHPELGTRYAIDIVSPIDFIFTE